jgi:HlyD family secretion protein
MSIALPLAMPLVAPSGDHRAYAQIGFFAVAVVFGAFGGFAAKAPLDSAAIAQGRVAAETSTKPLQHLEGGIVREILVKESSQVKEGQVLFRLEPTQARANTEMLKKQIDAALAMETRLLAERDAATTLEFPAALLARKSVPETAAALSDQEKRFVERRRLLDSKLNILNARVEQTMKELGGAQRQEASYKDQIASMTTEINAVTALAEKGNYPRNKLLALQRERTRLDGQLGALEGDMARNREVIAEARLQMRQAQQQYADEASQQLPEVRTRLSDAREKLAVADDVMARVEVRAPQAGVVQGIKVLSPGAVVKPGETLAELVPTGDKLVMSVRASPLDIDSIEKGQSAEIRFPAFATREFPIILGTVDRVAADAMHDETTKEPYYLVRVLVDPATVPEPVLKRLVPGMPADVLISTGERTILQYLVGPLANVFAKSMREM